MLTLFQKIAQKLIFFVPFFFRCLRQCVSQMLENHSIIFNRIISRIDLDQNTDFQKGFYVVSEELFQGQVLTWGRIVSLFAYGARLAQHCVENDMSNMVIDVVSSLSHVAVDKLTPFLKDHGGWVRICFYSLSKKLSWFLSKLF